MDADRNKTCICHFSSIKHPLPTSEPLVTTNLANILLLKEKADVWLQMDMPKEPEASVAAKVKAALSSFQQPTDGQTQTDSSKYYHHKDCFYRLVSWSKINRAARKRKVRQMKFTATATLPVQ